MTGPSKSRMILEQLLLYLVQFNKLVLNCWHNIAIHALVSVSPRHTDVQCQPKDDNYYGHYEVVKYIEGAYWLLAYQAEVHDSHQENNCKNDTQNELYLLEGHCRQSLKVNLPLIITHFVHISQHLLDGNVTGAVEVLHFFPLEPVAVLIGNEYYFLRRAERVDNILLFYSLGAGQFFLFLKLLIRP